MVVLILLYVCKKLIILNLQTEKIKSDKQFLHKKQDLIWIPDFFLQVSVATLKKFLVK